MIKPVEEIPMSVAEKRKSYRQMIRDDINEAIEKKIPRFEFEGDYNYKYLSQYAKEEADNVTSRIMRDRIKEMKEQGLVPDNTHSWTLSKWNMVRPFIKISNKKMEDRNHVYCEIFLDDLDNIILETQKLVEERTRASKERREQIRKEREARKNAGKDNGGDDREERKPQD
jgi:hypothetical protein